MSDYALRLLPAGLIAENGGAFGSVCIWRPDDSGGSARKGTVGEWLSRREHQSGDWLIDGGWGGPPGPVRVTWNAQEQAWRSLGFPPWEASR